jgi:hypothetical protein
MNCAECGTGITEQTVLDGDAGPLVMVVEDHMLEVPGLYVCTPCAGAIMVGERRSTVTKMAAVEFLMETYVPLALNWLSRNEGTADQAFFESAKARMQEALELAEILCIAGLLEMMEEAAAEEGVDREDMAVMVVFEGPGDKSGLN